MWADLHKLGVELINMMNPQQENVWADVHILDVELMNVKNIDLSDK